MAKQTFITWDPGGKLVCRWTQDFDEDGNPVGEPQLVKGDYPDDTVQADA